MKSPAPAAFTPDTFAAWPLSTLADAIVTESRTTPDRVSIRPLIQGKEMRVLLAALPAGAVMKEHRTPRPLWAVPLRGSLRFDVGTRSEQLDSEAGAAALSIGPGLAHEVTALSDAVFLLVLGAKHE